jgi:hypothetical protein
LCIATKVKMLCVQGGLLGNKPIGFGTTTSSASTGFGAGGGLFNKPATSSAFNFGGGTAGTTGFGGWCPCFENCQQFVSTSLKI